jgi:phospholipid/cholesterol/gamma-HCH transport system substrate-binding protein
VIPTRPGALGQLLNTAPELLERVTTLVERLTEMLSARNQESSAGILENVREISRNLAERSPEIAATLAEARTAIRQAGAAADQIGQLAGTTNATLNEQGRPLVADLRRTLQSAQRTMDQLEGAVGEARPGLRNLSQETLPEVDQMLRELRATSESLRDVTDRLNRQGVGGVIGGQRLPDYRPRRGN